MKLAQLFEETKLLAVVYGGRFQPFHKGHYACYQQLCNLFGSGPVWIGSSNTVNMGPSGNISPLNFDERAEVMTQMFDIEQSKIIKCKNPAFTPHEVVEMYNAPVVLVVVCGSKDAERYEKAKKYRPYPMKNGKPVDHQNLSTVTGPDKLIYYFVCDAKDGPQSGTSIRAAFKKASSVSDQKVLMKKFFNKDDADIRDLLVGKFEMIEDPKPKKLKESKDLVKILRWFNEYFERHNLAMTIDLTDDDQYVIQNRGKVCIDLGTKEILTLIKALTTPEGTFAYYFMHSEGAPIKRFEIGEPMLAKNARCATNYAIGGLQNRFKLGEPAIKTDPESLIKYNNFLIKKKLKPI